MEPSGSGTRQTQIRLFHPRSLQGNLCPVTLGTDSDPWRRAGTDAGSTGGTWKVLSPVRGKGVLVDSSFQRRPNRPPSFYCSTPFGVSDFGAPTRGVTTNEKSFSVVRVSPCPSGPVTPVSQSPFCLPLKNCALVFLPLRGPLLPAVSGLPPKDPTTLSEQWTTHPVRDDHRVLQSPNRGLRTFQCKRYRPCYYHRSYYYSYCVGLVHRDIGTVEEWWQGILPWDAPSASDVCLLPPLRRPRGRTRKRRSGTSKKWVYDPRQVGLRTHVPGPKFGAKGGRLTLGPSGWGASGVKEVDGLRDGSSTL